MKLTAVAKTSLEMRNIILTPQSIKVKNRPKGLTNVEFFYQDPDRNALSVSEAKLALYFQHHSACGPQQEDQ